MRGGEEPSAAQVTSRHRVTIDPEPDGDQGDNRAGDFKQIDKFLFILKDRSH